MLPSSFRVSLTVLAVCAVAVSASPDLTVGASGETLKLPNDPRGVLDPSSGNTLTIVDTGVAGPADPSALTALLPGDSVNVTHHCKRIVSITFDHLTKPPNLFTNIDADGTREDLYATAEGIAKINLPGDLAVSRSLHDRRALFVGGCSEEREDMILDTADVAQEILFEAYDHIYRMRTPTDRYKTWFGSYTPNRGRKVKDIIWWSKVTQLSSFRFNCTCDFTKVDPLSVAYVSPDIPGNMWVCPRLWFNDLDYRAGIFVHELTHFLGIGDTGDKKYGSDACKRLARDDPDLAIKNADNYKFFALAGTGRPTID